MRIQILILGFEGLSNKDGDVNEKGKKPIGLDCQDNWLTLHVQHAFLHIYLPSLHGYNVKVLNFTFCGGREHLLGTLRSDDGDGNGNATKAIGLISKTTILHVHHAFCTFLCRHCTVTTWKCLTSRCTEEVHKRFRDFLSLSELGYGS